MFKALTLSSALASRCVLKPQTGLFRLSSLADDFTAAQSRVTELKEDPGNAAKLKLYALFKQASSGQCNAKRPGMIDFVGRAKWDAWNALGDMSPDAAMKEYITYVEQLSGEQTAAAGGAAPVESGSEHIQVSKTNRVTTIKINRPDKKNAITVEMYQAIIDAMKQAGDDPDTSVTVICAEGNDYFSSGNDLSMFLRALEIGIPEMAKQGKELFQNYIDTWIEHPKLLVVLVNGPSVGVAVTTLPLADAVYASDKATFHTPFPSLGQSPEGCSSFTFPRLMGTGAATEALLLGRKLDAAAALRANLVTEVFPDAEFRQLAQQRVDAYAKLPPKTLCISKNLLRRWHRQQLLDINAHEAEQLRQTWLAEECQQAVANFFKK